MATLANSISAPKIDRAAVMRAAWEQTKAWYLHRGRAFKFVKAEFQWALRCAWHDARLALMTEAERQIDQFERALARLTYGNDSASNRAYERELRAELASLRS